MDKVSNISEAPTTNSPIENKSTVEYEINKETKLKAIFNDKVISFKISTFSLLKKDYELFLTLEELYKLNRFFINFENIKELVNWLIKSFEQKNTCIKFTENKCILQMKNPITNTLFELTLNSKEKDLNSRVNYLEAFIVEQNKININLEERIKKLEAIISSKNEIRNEKKIFFESELVNKEEQEMLINWLPRKPNKISLLLNSNKDGDSTLTFINKCGGKCPTLAIIKTTKGYIFGGYTTQFWKEGVIPDKDAFVFSINKKKKYNIIKSDYAIGFGKNSWWGFGYQYNAIVIIENCTKINDNWVDNDTYDIKEKYELNGGEKYFTVKSFELFHIEY